MKPGPAKRQLFVIPSSVWTSLEQAEVEATALAMKTLGIFHLPYPSIDVLIGDAAIRWCVDEAVNSSCREAFEYDVRKGLLIERDGGYIPNYGPDFWLYITNLSLDHLNGERHIRVGPRNPHFKPHTVREDRRDQPLRERDRDLICMILIVLLATRNTRKEITHNKLAALGIGLKKHPHEYVTTIHLPETPLDSPDLTSGPSTPGTPKRPHLRRGHIRIQRFGPERSFSRQQWIEPVFVNADKDWVDSRARYNVSL